MADILVQQIATRTEHYLTNSKGEPVHKLMVVHKDPPRIITFPATYSETRGVVTPKIKEIELRGWSTLSEVPTRLKRGGRISLSHKQVSPVMRRLYIKFPKLSKLAISRTGRTRLSAQKASFSWADFEALIRAVGREITMFEERRKAAVINGLADVSGAFQRTGLSLARGGLTQLLEPFDSVALSQEDADRLLEMVAHVPIGNVRVTANYIETKNKVNAAYLENVIAEFERLLTANNDNEKEWQRFFGEHGWILAHLFPYQVILRDTEAYVGGKTIENKEGRVVDFLFQNGFRDNYALLEIKTHNTQLLKPRAYRDPEAFAQHEECSGAISQCLDQKNTFQTEFGQRYRTLDPKVVLIIGQKRNLSEKQRAAFELMRSNQKNVDVVTFDEVLEKIKGLKSILQTGS